MNPLHFKIDQIALNPKNPTLARELLFDLGLTHWSLDDVAARGKVHGIEGDNHALLQFNYQAGTGIDEDAKKPLELEILHYTAGNNWMRGHDNVVSHLGMHVNPQQLSYFRSYFARKGIGIAQEVVTTSHSNPAIKDERRYNYVIFDTREILGVDLKFIVRLAYISPDWEAMEGQRLKAFQDGVDAGRKEALAQLAVGANPKRKAATAAAPLKPVKRSKK
jgi:hypothetical protein